MTFVMDEFDDESIDAMWELALERAGVDVTETAAGDLQWYCDTDCTNEWWSQYPASDIESFDFYSKITIPTRAELIGADVSAGLWYSIGNDYNYVDFALWFADSAASYYAEDCDYNDEILFTQGRTFALWIDGYYDVYKDASEFKCIDYVIALGDEQNEVWVRYRYDSQRKLMTFFYAIREPIVNTDWILAYQDFPIDVNDAGDNPYLGFSQWGNTGNHLDKTFKIAYVRSWPEQAVEPPSLDQYQRLQGYPKVTHPLVFNRNTGEFEVMEQPRPAAPLPLVEGADVLAYDGSGNLSTITRTIGGITYVKTLTYTAGNLTGVTVWVEQ